jgi:hypothetical protein
MNARRWGSEECPRRPWTTAPARAWADSRVDLGRPPHRPPATGRPGGRLNAWGRRRRTRDGRRLSRRNSPRHTRWGHTPRRGRCDGSRSVEPARSRDAPGVDVEFMLAVDVRFMLGVDVGLMPGAGAGLMPWGRVGLARRREWWNECAGVSLAPCASRLDVPALGSPIEAALANGLHPPGHARRGPRMKCTRRPGRARRATNAWRRRETLRGVSGLGVGRMPRCGPGLNARREPGAG